MENTPNPQQHWYRSGYVWLVLTPLLVTVLGFFYTMHLLFASGNIDQLPGLGSKLGKIHTDQISADITARLHRDSATIAGAAYHAQLWLTLPSTVVTAKGDPVRPGDTLELQVLHPTLSNRDRQLQLERSQHEYSVQLDAPLPQRGTLWLRDPASDWQQVLPYRLVDDQIRLDRGHAD